MELGWTEWLLFFLIGGYIERFIVAFARKRTIEQDARDLSKAQTRFRDAEEDRNKLAARLSKVARERDEAERLLVAVRANSEELVHRVETQLDELRARDDEITRLRAELEAAKAKKKPRKKAVEQET